MKFDYKVYGDDQLLASLSRYGQSITDWTPLWDMFEEEFYGMEEKLFETQGASGSRGAWEALSPRYSKWKHGAKSPYRGKPILQLTGRLMNSLTKDGPDSINFKSPKEFRIGTAVEYAAAHYHGVRDNNLPSRRPIDMNDQQRSKWMKITHEWIVKEERAAGIK